MAALMMSGMCASLQAELDALFGALEGRGGVAAPSVRRSSAKPVAGCRPNCSNWPALI
ncbi:hypothetical protein SAMN05443245_3575 [Paraburkholderia fungorum]|uniref:Uncharacterized protein n=1 Tax=Paraburkholderia fungorum TaxID=134537 RepID=A0A1H1H7B5_9BURK|nr:hypothetical protein [Paraburkholderia fungorum]SDR20988.1 hypothetical protein SAMN05443245_3575 [Paraburkholderia fungorum]